MEEKLVETLLRFPTEEHVENVCKLGQGEKTCCYLTTGPNGWSCAKSSSLRQTIDERVASGTMNAKADNCEGLLGFIIEHQQELVGKKVEYEESMPSYRSAGPFKRMEVKNGNFFIFWDDDGERDNATNVKYLDITVSLQRITFGVARLGSFAGRTTIILN